MDAGHQDLPDEAHDHFNVDGGEVGAGAGSPGRFSEAQRSPGLRSESRVSEFSEGEEGRQSRQSEVSRDTGARSPGIGAGAGAVRRKPVGGEGL